MRLSIALVLTGVALSVGACRSADESSAPAGPNPVATTSTRDLATRCPELVAELPADLQYRVERAGDDGVSAYFGVMWSDSTRKNPKRIVSLSTASSDEPRGDGATVAPVTRTVQGVTARETIVGGVHQVLWKSPASGTSCPYWAVVTHGLTDRELDSVLASVRVRDAVG